MSWVDAVVSRARAVVSAVAGVEEPTPTAVRYRPSWWDSYLLSISIVTDAKALAGILRESEAGDPRREFALFDRMRAQDAHLDSELQKAEDALTEAGLTFLPYSSVAQDAKTDAKANEVLEYVKRVLTAPDVDLDTAIVALAHADWKMLGAFHFVTRAEGDRECVEVLEEIPAQRFRLSTEMAGPPRWVYSPNGDHEFEALETQGPAVVVRFTDEGIPNLANRGLMRRLMNLWLIKHRGLVWWAQAIEKYGIPLLFIEDDTQDDTQLDTLTTKLKNLGAQGVGVFARGGKPQLLEAAKTITGKYPHEEIADWCDRQMARAINGHDQSSTVGKDTASKQSQDFAGDAALRRGNARGKKVAFTFRQQLVGPLVARRFGPVIADQCTPIVQLRIAKEKNLVAFTEALKNAIDAGVDTIPKALIHEETGWRQAAKGEETIKRIAPPNPLDGGKVLPFQPKGPAKARVEAALRELLAVEDPDGPAEDLDELNGLAERQAAGSGTVLLGPYRDLIAAAVKDGATVQQVLSRVLHRATQEELLDKDRFTELMAAARLEALRRGAVAVREAQGAANG